MDNLKNFLIRTLLIAKFNIGFKEGLPVAEASNSQVVIQVDLSSPPIINVEYLIEIFAFKNCI